MEVAAGAVIAHRHALRSELKPAPQLVGRGRLLIEATGLGEVAPWSASAGSLPDRYRNRDRVATSSF